MDTDQAAGLFALVQETLLAAGFEQYEISNYAHSPRKRCKHNLTYWDGFADYVSFGPSAHEFLKGTRSWNVSSLDRYKEFIEEGKLPHINSEHPSFDQRRTEVLYCQLRSTGIERKRFEDEFGEDIFSHPEILYLLEDGMVQEKGGILGLTQKGYRYCDAVVLRLMSEHEYVPA